MPNTSVSKGIAYAFHTGGAAAAVGNAYAIPPSFDKHQVLIKTSAGVSAGAITIECADTPDYAGTWDTVTSAITVPAASAIDVYNFTGIFRALRARISTEVQNGTVDVSGISSN